MRNSHGGDVDLVMRSPCWIIASRQGRSHGQHRRRTFQSALLIRMGKVMGQGSEEVVDEEG